MKIHLILFHSVNIIIFKHVLCHRKIDTKSFTFSMETRPDSAMIRPFFGSSPIVFLITIAPHLECWSTETLDKVLYKHSRTLCWVLFLHAEITNYCWHFPTKFIYKLQFRFTCTILQRTILFFLQTESNPAHAYALSPLLWQKQTEILHGMLPSPVDLLDTSRG